MQTLFALHAKFLQWIKRLDLSFLWSQKHLSSGFYGYNSINSTQEPHKWHQFQKLFVDCRCLFYDIKTLWYGKYYYCRSFGQIGHVSIQIRQNRSIWLVGFGKNLSRCRYAVYLDGVQRLMPNSWSLFDVSSTGTSRDERTSWSDLENVAYNCARSYGIC